MQRIVLDYHKGFYFMDQELWEFAKFVRLEQIKEDVKKYIKNNSVVLLFNSFKYYSTDDDFFREKYKSFNSKMELITIV